VINCHLSCISHHFHVEFDGVSVRLIGYYRSGGYDVSAIDYMFNTVKCLKFLCSTDKTVFMLGDFNLPDADWEYSMVLTMLFITHCLISLTVMVLHSLSGILLVIIIY